jgi:hypothetical protein
MFLFSADPDLDEFSTKGQEVSTTINKIADSLNAALDANQVMKTITGMDNEAKKLQRTISGGLTIGAEAFREKMFRVYNESVKFGASFQSVLDYTGDLSTAMEKMVYPIESAAIDALALGHNVGMAEKETGKMVGTFTTFSMSQRTSVQQMSKIAKVARETGLQASALLKTMEGSLSKLVQFNFKDGIDGLTKMTAQAQRLGTTSEKLKIFTAAETLFDPEKAIEMAANLSMLGGSVEGLTNPFMAMNDAANNVDRLQENIINMGKSAFSFDEVTGKIKTNFVAQQQLRAQAEATGVAYDELANAAQRAVKEEAVQNKLLKEGVDISQFSEEQQNMIKSLAEIGPGGKIDFNIPGLESEDLVKTISDNPNALKTALEEYQKAADMSDRQIAEKGLNTQEELQRDVRIIRDTYIRSLSSTERTSIVSKIDSGVDILSTQAKKMATNGVEIVKNGINNVSDAFAAVKTTMENENTTASRTRKETAAKEKQNYEFVFDSTTGQYKAKPVTVPDAVIPENSNGLVKFGKNEIFNFIKEDQAIIAPDAIEKVNFLKDVYVKFMDMQNSIPNEVKLASPKEIPNKTQNLSNPFDLINKGEKTETNSTQTINVNITVDGKNVSTMTNIDPKIDRDIEKKIKDTIQNISFWDKSKSRVSTKQ